MKLEIKERWIAALESGQYQHAQYRLKSPFNIGSCCLGVLADVCSEELLADGNRVEISETAIHVNGVPTSLDDKALITLGISGMTANALIKINDDLTTSDFTKQVAYIKEHM